MKLNAKSIGIVIASTAALLLSVALVAFSQGPAGPRGGRDFERGPGREGFGLFTRDLNLSDDQKAQIEKIRTAFEESTRSLHEQMRALHENEGDPLNTAFDEAAVRSAAEARAKIDVELEVARAKMMSQIGSVLTTEQKAQLAAKRLQRRPPPPPPAPGQ